MSIFNRYLCEIITETDVIDGYIAIYLSEIKKINSQQDISNRIISYYIKPDENWKHFIKEIVERHGCDYYYHIVFIESIDEQKYKVVKTYKSNDYPHIGDIISVYGRSYKVEQSQLFEDKHVEALIHNDKRIYKYLNITEDELYNQVSSEFRKYGRNGSDYLYYRFMKY